MKINTLLVILIGLVCITCHSIVENVEITLNLEGYKPSTPIYYAAITGGIPIPDSVIADKNGHATIKLFIDKPHLFSMYCKQENGYFICPFILIKPNEKHSITCQLTQKYHNNLACKIDGPNSAGQFFFKKIDDGQRASIQGFSIFAKSWDVTNPETLQDSLNSKNNRAILPFQKLFEAGKVDSAFLGYIKIYVSYYYAFQLATFIQESLYKNPEPELKDQFEKIADELFKKYPVSNPNIIYTSVLHDYVDLYLICEIRKHQKEYDNYAAKGLKQTYELNMAKKVLTKEAYKYYAIESIWSKACWQDKETLDLFAQYKLDYPDYTKSKYYQMLENESIPAIKELYEPKNKKLPSGVLLLDKEKPIISFSDLTAHFKGKYIFIDCWATWCGSCIDQFQYNAPLKAFLKENGVEMVYIAFERNSNRIKLENFIRKYDLTGFHVVLNDSLKNDLYATLKHDATSGFAIPRYILVDKNGNIAINSTFFPSDKEKLYTQLKEKINN